MVSPLNDFNLLLPPPSLSTVADNEAGMIFARNVAAYPFALKLSQITRGQEPACGITTGRAQIAL